MVVVVAPGINMWALGKGKKKERSRFSHSLAMHLHAIGPRLTYTGIHALRPTVINISVADSSAVLEPSAARSATTGSAGFLERAAL